MRKVLTIVGTRPELIKMCRVIATFDQHTEHTLVHTGQNFDYELNQIFFDQLGIRKPDFFLEAGGGTPVETIARVLTRSDEVLAKVSPEALLLYGDTNSCLAVIAAKRRKIPVFHMEAGNRCFDQRVPEELNRKVVDHLSDINMTLTEHARRYLLAEGLSPERVIKVGSHMQEVLTHFMSKIDASDVLRQLGLSEGSYFLVSAHREENVDSPQRIDMLLDSLNGLAETYGHDVIVSTHPRTRQRLDALGSARIDTRIRFSKPFGFIDYIKLQMGAACVLSDSGTITEEASLLNLPAVTIRDCNERPEGMDVGTLIMCGLRRGNVLDSVRLVMAEHNRHERRATLVPDYDAGLVSQKVLRVVLSYIDYINEAVWRKPV